MTRPLRTLWATGAAALLLTLGPRGAHAGDLNELMDDLVRRGEEAPKAAIESLDELDRLGTATTPAQRRALAYSVGVVAARNGWEKEAQFRIHALESGHPADALALAAAHVVRAELLHNAAHGEAAYDEARAALVIYDGACAPAAERLPECDYRAWWQALHDAYEGAMGQGNVVVAGSYAQSMFEVARRASDRPREAIATDSLALLAEGNGDPTTANRLVAQAKRISRTDGSPWLEISVDIVDAQLHRRRQQLDAAAQIYMSAAELAKTAKLERLGVKLAVNLSDVYVRLDRPSDALAAVERALPVARSHNDLRSERLLLHNATLGRLQLGRVAEAKPVLAHVMEMLRRDAGPGEQAEALREFGDALEKAGDIPSALELYHQEEALRNDIRYANKVAAEAEMRARYDRESQQRRIELLARDNQLKTAKLENQALARHLWMFGGAALVLLGVLAVLMYLRMRELNRTLVKHEALLRAHSERDALTGLANRRQFREVMRLRGGETAFQGALLMVDVDHFKHINDHYGHTPGDRVLVEVARRLGAAMRGDDLVARWGGEEFLVFAPGVSGRELDQLAERVRAAICDEPVTIDGETRLDVTVSIGYAAFPLPASHVPVTWEQAVNLADMSLYTAKNRGRNCAVGIVRTTAGTSEALRELEADLALAHAEGRVTLRVLPPQAESADLADA